MYFLFGRYIYVDYICSVIIKQLENMTTQNTNTRRALENFTGYTCNCELGAKIDLFLNATDYDYLGIIEEDYGVTESDIIEFEKTL